MLVITVAGGLAANIGTVILVGAAVGLERLRGNGNYSLAVFIVLVAILAATGIFAAILIMRRNRVQALPGWLIWPGIVLCSLGILKVVLIFTGLAAGVK